MNRNKLILFLYFDKLQLPQLDNFMENNYEPLIIDNYNELQNYIKLDNFMKLFFFNFEKIKTILYNQNINIKIYDTNKPLYYYFYVDLIIKKENVYINIEYQFDFINNMHNKNAVSNYSFRKIITSKIIYDLIINYDDINTYEKQSQELIKNNQKIIIDNILYLNNIGLNLDEYHIIELGIDELLVQIIIALIKTNKFEDEEYISNITWELDLYNINITQLMFDKLNETLNNDYIDYQITIQNLFEENIINFYYFLLKNILKNSLYIYKIDFLYKQRITIINIINNLLYFFFIPNIYINEKLDYILKTFTDSKLYEKFMKKIEQMNNSSNGDNYVKFYSDDSSFNVSEDRENAINNSQSIESEE